MVAAMNLAYPPTEAPETRLPHVLCDVADVLCASGQDAVFAADIWHDELLKRLTGQERVTGHKLVQPEACFQAFTDFADEHRLRGPERQLLADQALMQLLQML